jgi:hypothetical protein
LLHVRERLTQAAQAFIRNGRKLFDRNPCSHELRSFGGDLPLGILEGEALGQHRQVAAL